MSDAVRGYCVALWIAILHLISIGDVDRRADVRQARIEALERELALYRRRHAPRG